jgi:hypothetical protein
LKETLAGRQPPQLLMTILGEGGAGKSRVIQTITDLFVAKLVLHMLAKGAYTGIAGSVVGGTTLHSLAMIPLNGREPSMKTMKKLTAFWANKKYLIIDEMSMLSKKFLNKISNILARAKTGDDTSEEDLPFGGVNVILAGDFHQFPPVVTKKNSPLYYPMNQDTDGIEDMNGRKIYEKFNVVVWLKQQFRSTDPVWTDLLRHVRYGTCREEHLQILRDLIVTSPKCPRTDYNAPPWNDAVLITPRHGVRLQWNRAALRHFCSSTGRQLFQCPAEDTIDGNQLTKIQRVQFMMSKAVRQQEKTGLPTMIELAVGMKVMVTFNVQTEMDIANGARGEIVNIVLDERETTYDSDSPIVRLFHPPSHILVRLYRTKMPALQDLPECVVPIVPMTRSITISVENQEKLTIQRRQLPITGAYALTDYRGQGQTLVPVYADIGTPPSGKRLTPFNAYVALSRAKGRDHIRLIRDFDAAMFTQHPSEYLRLEDERLALLDSRTRLWWETFVNKRKQTSRSGGSPSSDSGQDNIPPTDFEERSSL